MAVVVSNNYLFYIFIVIFNSYNIIKRLQDLIKDSHQLPDSIPYCIHAKMSSLTLFKKLKGFIYMQIS